MKKALLQNKNQTVTPTTSGAAAAFSSVTDNGRLMEVSVKANSANSGAIYIRAGATGDFVPLNAEDSATFIVNDTADLVAYSDNGTEVANCIIHTTY